MWSCSTIQLHFVVDTHSGRTYPENIDAENRVEAPLPKATITVDRMVYSWLVESTVERAPQSFER